MSDSRTLNQIIGRCGLEPFAGGYPWRWIFRAVHRTEAHLLAGHLERLKARHGTPAFEHVGDDAGRAAARAQAQGSPIIDAIDDLEAELKAPLWTFAQMACALGARPNTLSKALVEGRETLAFPTLQLGPRVRRYRPLEVRLWRDDGVLLDLPPTIHTVPQITRRTPPRPVDGADRISAPTPAEQAEEALFGRFARDSRTKRGCAEIS